MDTELDAAILAALGAEPDDLYLDVEKVPDPAASVSDTTQDHLLEEPKWKCPRNAACSFATQKMEMDRYNYVLGHFLGEGSSSIVRMATMKPAKEKIPRMARYVEKKGHNKVAVKIIDIKAAPKDFIKSYTTRELQIHHELPVHNNVIHFLESFRTAKYIYIVSELCTGDLLSNINFGENKEIPVGLSEEKARRYFRQLCFAVNHLHKYNFAHRDLKLENILLDQDNTIKLSDFGFGIGVKNNTVLKIACGSYGYASPEVLTNKTYDAKVADLWSLGIILYAMVNGTLPYDDDRIPYVEDLMRKQKFKFAKPVSREYKDLISRILQHDTARRATLSEIMHHPWLRLTTTCSKSRKDRTTETTTGFKTPYKCNEKHSPAPALARKKTSMATVMVQKGLRETVTLRSRAQGKLNNYVLATSSNIRGGKAPKFSMSRLLDNTTKCNTPEPELRQTPEDVVKFVEDKQEKKDVGVGPAPALSNAEIKKKPTECINKGASATPDSDALHMVENANSPRADLEFMQFRETLIVDSAILATTTRTPKTDQRLSTASPCKPEELRMTKRARRAPLKCVTSTSAEETPTMSRTWDLKKTTMHRENVTGFKSPRKQLAKHECLEDKPWKSKPQSSDAHRKNSSEGKVPRGRVSPVKAVLQPPLMVPTPPKKPHLAEGSILRTHTPHPPKPPARVQPLRECGLSISPTVLPIRSARVMTNKAPKETAHGQMIRRASGVKYAVDTNLDELYRHEEKKHIKPKTGSASRAAVTATRHLDSRGQKARAPKPSQH